MKSYQRLLCLLSLGCICAAMGLWCQGRVAAADIPPVPTRADNDAATRKGFDYFYNLEYDKAIREFEAAQQAHPNDPFAVNHTLEAVIFKELYRTGALDTEAYAGDSFLNKKLAAPLDPKVRDRVKQLSDQALALSQARLDKNPNDVDALYARGVTRGMRATYMGVGGEGMVRGLAQRGGRSPRPRARPGARPEVHRRQGGCWHGPLYCRQSELADQSGSFHRRHQRQQAEGAGLSAPGVDRGAQRGRQRRADRPRPVPAARAEVRRSAAGRGPHAGGISSQPLVATEYAHLLNAAGHGPQAIAAYRKVMAGCRSNVYSSCRIEVPAYGLGEALRGQRQYQEAAEAYELAASSSTTDPDLRQKATLAAGQMYDVLQKRDTALEKYRAVVAENSTSGSAELARHYMKEAYRSP